MAKVKYCSRGLQIDKTKVEKASVWALVDSNIGSIVRDLQMLIKQPSVSARNTGLVNTASLVMQIMDRAGIRAELLYLGGNGVVEKGQLETNNTHEQQQQKTSNGQSKTATAKPQLDLPPIVYGEAKSKSNPQGKTILFYNHYDVQPEDPADLWKDDPFSGRVEGNRIYGRGASDDKGEIITRIKAVEYFLQATDGDLPCNVKFIVEGEEEIGSPHLRDYLLQYKDKLKCDVVIWESGYIDSKSRSVVSLGQKGILCVELNAIGPSHDIHSSHAVLVENPAITLSKIICSMVSQRTGKILIEDWNREVKGFSRKELMAIAQEEFDEEDFKRETGVKSFAGNKTGFDAKRARVGEPTCNVSGLVSGYWGPGFKTIIPSTATAKIDFRLVPEMDPHIQFQRLQNHIARKIGPKREGEPARGNKVEARFLTGEPGYRTPLDNPFVTPVVQAAKEAFNSSTISVSGAGTGPMYYFYEILGKASSICVGGSSISDKIHSPNENFQIDNLVKATKCIVKIIEKVGKL
ncbi:MAG: M20/M25/M40 family metallo-hydrolase [Thermoproteota archaeon]|nr:M20/M25/M40 family metallo-hydrolase [Thermoproteota archaeon]